MDNLYYFLMHVISNKYQEEDILKHERKQYISNNIESYYKF